MTRPATTIDEVIGRLTEIVDDSKRRQSRAGYFAALYRKVTVTVRQRIVDGNFFDDSERMERLDVLFANRYLAAYEQMQDGSPQLTRCWDTAFQTTHQFWPIALQHLLLGMNAHINLDLGIAALEAAGAEPLPSLHDDFSRINALLAGLVGDVKRDLASVWPPLRWLQRFLGSPETSIINFSMTAARDAAWSFAEELTPLGEADRNAAIARRDAEVRRLAHVVRNPGVFIGMVTKAVRLGERGSTADVIGRLE